MADSLELEYVKEQIEDQGYLEEFEDGISYCPYCGYANELDIENWEETSEEETECGKCSKLYLESIEILTYRYTKTMKLEEENALL